MLACMHVICVISTRAGKLACCVGRGERAGGRERDGTYRVRTHACVPTSDSDAQITWVSGSDDSRPTTSDTHSCVYLSMASSR